MRLFVAVDPPAYVRGHLTARLHDLPLHDPAPQDVRLHDPAPHHVRQLRWTAPEQWHVTLAFLADVPDSKVNGLSAALSTAATALAGFTASLAGAGAFPRPARATTLWCGIDPGSTELAALAAAVATAVQAAGLSLDDRPFHPHLTLARCQPTDLRPVVRRLADYRGPQFPVHEIALVSSRLGGGADGRAAHEVISRWRLERPRCRRPRRDQPNR
jgi:RNA 2',3'-cyclic 3'-phosphodiesterase